MAADRRIEPLYQQLKASIITRRKTRQVRAIERG
jgi:hypothetical protein